ncbi:uncharacterized protein K452DRAFT_251605 [Aplosporella prunicola CBS 121167]|uniref:Spc7 kinetochore protein domain-containing protein n=1 Tax=Aplosporella prunicola CBS 121167 TaxID=1176127 RepID=A0A6A6BB74_9PEZI|nr:uncharacterized protein K452DRAFT_251605 [Aplosporella prunicola CBS 121167]KAF2140848.1 hypothetical protein K452DRAFT_251605 [Aplosporella prunicola CBS 121167]
MATDHNKENIADGLNVALTAPTKAPALSPKKSSRKSRSKSIGPGGLEEPLKENAGNRRKSMMPAVAPAVKSILSREDEVKRREERRKSLAKRRVSFAPEATLHTWDVVEYMRDATSSSASSNSTRRASNMTHHESSSPERGSGPDSDPADPPSTPPEQVEDPTPESSPAKQRDLHQKKRRRSSGIPPMNFNNPDDVYSSSPYSGESADGSDDIEIASDDDGGSTMMSIDMGDGNEQTQASVASDDSTGTSARLDAALRQAAAQAGTRRFDFDEDNEDDASMEMAGDEITAAFKPWVQKSSTKESSPPKAEQAEQQQENEEEMSMDITRAIGGIMQPQRQPESPEQENMTMEFTTALGSIQSTEQAEQPSTRAGNKRRRSSTMSATNDQGSPAKRQSRRMSIRRRQSAVEGDSLEDGTMDLTMAVGGIQADPAPEKPNRRESVNNSFGDETMDFTMVMGGINSGAQETEPADETIVSKDGNEDLSMEFTAILGGIKTKQTVPEPSTPQSKGVTVATPPSKRGSAARFTNNHPEVPSPSPVKASNATLALADTAKPMPALNIVKDNTPKKSPRRSLRRSTRNSLASATPEVPVASNLSPPEDQAKSSAPTPAVENAENDNAETAPSADVQYPTLPELAPEEAPVESTPTKTPTEPTPTKSAAESTPVKPDVESTPTKLAADPTPTEAPADPMSIDAPADPLPTEEPMFKRSMALTDSIKLLSTPRKQAYGSPLKRSIAFAPNESTPQKSTTPKKSPIPKKVASPRKQVQFNAASEEEEQEQVDSTSEKHDSAQDTPEGMHADNIQLHEFLELTNIRFMDTLTTTKRRHTGFPGAQGAFGKGPSNDDEMEGSDDLETCVVAAACTEPEYLMFQHACHELKKYISEGKEVVREIEESTYEDNPALFRDYLSAPPDQRYIMDNQFKNMKTNARLKTKEAWYGWRSNLLRDLKAGLTKTAESFDRDNATLKQQEEILDSVLPAVAEHHQALETEHGHLQRRAEELNGPDREELDATREQIIAAEAAIEEKKRLVEALQKELAEKETGIEATKERKVECLEEIKTAERVREECRGWSVEEVNALKARVSALEREYGWLITSASANPKTLTMTYRNDLQLFFQPASFAPHAAPSAPNSTTIRLTYIGDSPLTTTKRFFLQLLRANLHCLPQSTTTVPHLLAHIRSGWDVARAVAENVRKLDLAQVTEESILSDERMAVTTNMLLPTLQTKVKATFEVGVSVDGEDLKTVIETKVKVVYGEQYKEGRMGEFLSNYTGSEVNVNGEANWGQAVSDLKAQLIARGRKGARIA